MKFKVLIPLIIMVGISFLLIPAAPPAEAATIASLEPNIGEVGQSLKLTGSISCGGNYKIYWGSIKEENVVAQGHSTACAYLVTQFRVPETFKGRHRVIIVDLQNGEEASYDFTVVPAIKTSVEKGPVETVAIINGTGFAAFESDIQVIFEGTTVQQGITADIKGSWKTNAKIPASTKGTHHIQAAGALTYINEVGYVNFEVTPKISLEPTFGGVGTIVNVKGTGFTAGERGILINFDDKQVKSGISADNSGSFNTTFNVPEVEKRDHTVNVYIGNSKITEAGDVIFTVGTALTLQPDSGFVGDKITVFGSGFAANETDIKILYDDTQIASGITADTNGIWTTTFTLPDSIAGGHPVTASGKSTMSQNVKGQSFNILSQLLVNPASGEVGAQAEVTGKGFGKNQKVSIVYDEVQLTQDITTDIKGNFSAKFEIPVSPGEEHQINAIDNADNKAAVTFFTETTPPALPSPVSPPANTKIGLIGKQAVTFKWSEVNDLSGVEYTLEISREADFQSPILQKRNLTKNEYAMTEAEALEQGSYYWRVKAVDGAGNESNWTTAQVFTVSGLKMSIFLIISGIIIIALIIILWRFTPLIRRRE